MEIVSTQVCKCCGTEKALTEYHKEKGCRLGVQTQCKACLNARRKAKYYANIEHEKKRHKIYKDANRDRTIAQRKAWEERNPGHRKAYKEANKEKIAAQNAEYFQRVKERRAELAREKYRNDPMHAMKCRLRLRTRLAIKAKGFTKTSRIRQILGCDDVTLKKHIEGLFTEGMNWENRGEWHLDHKTPLAIAKSEDELLALCHYTNLQPLWAADNFAKGGRVGQEEAA